MTKSTENCTGRAVVPTSEGGKSRGEIETGLLGRWLRFTFFGWLLGFVLIVLLVLVWDLLGGDAQFMVGVGMGAGVGYLQGRAARSWHDSPWRWCMTSVVGMGSLFVLHDVLGLVGVGLPYSLPLYLVVGGLLTGLLQRQLLRPFSHRANWWVPANVIGWALPAGLVAAGDSGTFGAWGHISSLLGMFLGGVLLGAVTGMALVWILRSSSFDKGVPNRQDSSPTSHD